MASILYGQDSATEGRSVVVASQEVVGAGGIETGDRHLGRKELSCGGKCSRSHGSPIT